MTLTPSNTLTLPINKQIVIFVKQCMHKETVNHDEETAKPSFHRPGSKSHENMEHSNVSV